MWVPVLPRRRVGESHALASGERQITITLDIREVRPDLAVDDWRRDDTPTFVVVPLRDAAVDPYLRGNGFTLATSLR
jgi:hypothetical protein